MAPKSKFARYHANQGIIVCAIYIGWAILSFILLSVIKVEKSLGSVMGYSLGNYEATPGWLIAIVWLGYLAIMGISVLGIINAVQGKAKQIPFIGKFKILK